MAVEGPDAAEFEPPRIPASAGALIFDAADRLLILKPNYKKGWTIPGGQVEPDGESPWEACQRETFEECGIRVAVGRLACVDFLRPKRRRSGRVRAGGVRFLFDCGSFAASVLGDIVLDRLEIVEHRFVPVEEAMDLLSGPLRRRVSMTMASTHCLYLEDGEPVEGVTAHVEA